LTVDAFAPNHQPSTVELGKIELRLFTVPEDQLWEKMICFLVTVACQTQKSNYRIIIQHFLNQSKEFLSKIDEKMYHFDEQQVRFWIETLNLTQADVVQQLERASGQRQPGLSLRSLQRFCEKKKISSRSQISDIELRRHVTHAVTSATGLAGGYRSVKATLESRGVAKVAEKRIKRALLLVDPVAVAARRTMARVRLNPKRYFGRYFGYNLHMDQNEKVSSYFY
jgi:hypothetical protein